jgi:hypothetical protein
LDQKKIHYMRPIWNILRREESALTCARIGEELEKQYAFLPILAWVELFQILTKMVSDGTLYSKPYKFEMADGTGETTQYGIVEDSTPPPPPREERELETNQEQNPQHI